MNDIKEDLDQWRDILCSHIGRSITVKMLIPSGFLSIDCNHVPSSNLFIEINKLTPIM